MKKKSQNLTVKFKISRHFNIHLSTFKQAAMKELFNKAPEHQMATPAGGLLKKLYEEPKPGPNTPDQTAVKRIFQENDAAHQSKTPKLGMFSVTS